MRFDTDLAPFASTVPLKAVKDTGTGALPCADFRRQGHWDGWELFVRVLIFATRNNHRRMRGTALGPADLVNRAEVRTAV
jgi:hypothetical protein